MKRHNLFLVTVLSLLFSGLCMAHAGWFADGKTTRSAPRSAVARGQGKGFDPMNSQAALAVSPRPGVQLANRVDLSLTDGGNPYPKNQRELVCVYRTNQFSFVRQGRLTP